MVAYFQRGKLNLIFMQLQLVSHLLKHMIEQDHGLEVLHFIHGDCLEKVTEGILTLHSGGKENILYQLANIIAEKSMDIERMPFGLIDYNICFFNAESAVKIKMEELSSKKPCSSILVTGGWP